MRKNLLALSIAAMIGGVSGMANAAVFKSNTTVNGNVPANNLAAASVATVGANPATLLAPTSRHKAATLRC